MTSTETLIRNATPEELEVIATVAKRAHDLPAIVVTVDNGAGYGKTRRYVVMQEDEHYFYGVPTGKVPVKVERDGRPASISDIRMQREEHLGRFYFGCRWVRSFGRVDEMYRTLGSYEIVKVERIDRDKVYGGSR
jgi:hypothetical protein